MGEITHASNLSGGAQVSEKTAGPAYQAYQLLHWCFVALPTIVGIDKYLHRIANWNGYLAPEFARLSPLPVGTLMRVLGGFEIAVGLVVALRPKIGAYLLTAWLAGIVLNLLVARDFYDIVLRDLALITAALALARLATLYDRRGPITA